MDNRKFIVKTKQRKAQSTNVFATTAKVEVSLSVRDGHFRIGLEVVIRWIW